MVVAHTDGSAIAEPESAGRRLSRNPFVGVLVAILLIVGAVWMLESLLPDDETSVSGVDVESRAATPRIGEVSPDFTLDGLDARPIALSSLRGQPVLINFWASWCPPCRGEMPDLEEVRRDYAAAGLVVLAVNLREEAPTAQRYADALGLGFPVVLDRTARVAARYNVTGLPTSYFVGPDGVIRDLNVGALTGRALRGKIAKILT
ncbi:MAG: TlpA disulfide reductase family protein [Chloroflexota bacterium]